MKKRIDELKEKDNKTISIPFNRIYLVYLAYYNK